jgi:hypothetical protein
MMLLSTNCFTALVFCHAAAGFVDHGTQKLLRQKRWRFIAVAAVCAGLALTIVFVMMTSKDSSTAAITTATMQSAGLHADKHSDSNSAAQQHQQRALSVDHDGTVQTPTVQTVIDSIVQDIQNELSRHDLDNSDDTGTNTDTATAVINNKPLAAVAHDNNGRVKVSSERIATPSL